MNKSALKKSFLILLIIAISVATILVATACAYKKDYIETSSVVYSTDETKERLVVEETQLINSPDLYSEFTFTPNINLGTHYMYFLRINLVEYAFIPFYINFQYNDNQMYSSLSLVFDNQWNARISYSHWYKNDPDNETNFTIEESYDRFVSFFDFYLVFTTEKILLCRYDNYSSPPGGKSKFEVALDYPIIEISNDMQEYEYLLNLFSSGNLMCSTNFSTDSKYAWHNVFEGTANYGIPTNEFTVTFDYRIGNTEYGEEFTKTYHYGDIVDFYPPSTSVPDYRFASWIYDSNGQEYNNEPLTGETLFVAKWVSYIEVTILNDDFSYISTQNVPINNVGFDIYQYDSRVGYYIVNYKLFEEDKKYEELQTFNGFFTNVNISLVVVWEEKTIDISIYKDNVFLETVPAPYNMYLLEFMQSRGIEREEVKLVEGIDERLENVGISNLRIKTRMYVDAYTIQETPEIPPLTDEDIQKNIDAIKEKLKPLIIVFSVMIFVSILLIVLGVITSKKKNKKDKKVKKNKNRR